MLPWGGIYVPTRPCGRGEIGLNMPLGENVLFSTPQRMEGVPKMPWGQGLEQPGVLKQ